MTTRRSNKGGLRKPSTRARGKELTLQIVPAGGAGRAKYIGYLVRGNTFDAEKPATLIKSLVIWGLQHGVVYLDLDSRLASWEQSIALSVWDLKTR